VLISFYLPPDIIFNIFHNLVLLYTTPKMKSNVFIKAFTKKHFSLSCEHFYDTMTILAFYQDLKENIYLRGVLQYECM